MTNVETPDLSAPSALDAGLANAAPDPSKALLASAAAATALLAACGGQSDAPVLETGSAASMVSPRTAKQLEGIQCFSAEAELTAAVAQADIVICLLPLTLATESLLDAVFFSRLKAGAIFINVARGAIVDDEALLAALNNGQLQAACLDVFRQEPLPAQHPFWQHPAILITPHVSAVTNVSTVVAQIADNYRRSQRGELMANLVDINKGY